METPGCLDSLFSFVAEVTTGSTIDDDVSFGWSRLHLYYCNANCQFAILICLES